MDTKYIKIILLAAASALLLSYIVVPFLNGNGTITDLDGTMGYIDHSDIWGRIDPFSGIIYTIGDFICHQQMSRTIILNGNEMPVCVRDTGIVAGIVIGLAIMMFLKDYDRKKVLTISLLSFLITFLDWIIQNIYDLNVPETRFITGILAGAGAAFIVVMLLDGRLTDKI